MYLKSLTLRGFKSFASATTLNFEPGITCVVGPNGSGKSNVVDALSWVMGEQGAKSLRGGKMEDVIFAGTSGRAPLGRAEVSLTIDNTDGALPIDYTEVTITRTMFRNGGSDYSINGSSVRLLDVQELLSDSGIGREMHVIVGQGQLDTILQATPEIRRGFIEEAAGVLKHRKRKEKALRKLEATQANLDRLQDLVAEIRRQLKPLGRQAEVARKAAVIQAELRDAKARLLADDLTQATIVLETDLADEAALKQARRQAEATLHAAQQAEAEAEQALSQAQPRLSRAQETWYALAALRERTSTTQQIAAERVRNAEAQPEVGRQGRDPDQLEAEAEQVRQQEEELRAEVAGLTTVLATAHERRNQAEAAQAEADRAHAARLRVVADRREGLARLTGQVNALRSRIDAAGEEAARLRQRRDEAAERVEESAAQVLAATHAAQDHTGADEDLAAAVEQATARVDAVRTESNQVQALIQELTPRRAALQARIEALELGLDRGDATAALLDQKLAEGVIGPVSSMMRVEAGFEAAVAAALTTAVDGVLVEDLCRAVAAVEQLREQELGRGTLVLREVPGGPTPSASRLPAGARAVVDLVEAEAPLRAALDRALAGMVVVDDLAAAQQVVASDAELVVVTKDGDVLSSWQVTGGSRARQSPIEVQATIDLARAELAEVEQQLDARRDEGQRLHESFQEARQTQQDARQAYKTSQQEQGRHAQRVLVTQQAERSARGEVERLEQAVQAGQASREKDRAGLVELEARLANASAQQDVAEPDPAERDRLTELARLARTAEMDARLALRTGEERVRAVAGRADSLRRAAASERQAREEAQARATQLRREAAAATAVHSGAGWLLGRVEASQALAAQERDRAEQDRLAAEAELATARRASREAQRSLDQLVEGAHRDEMARIEVRMRIEQLGEKAMEELGLEPGVLMAEYGPEHFVPVLTRPDGTALGPDDEVPEPVAFVREQQAKRLRSAERNLQVLGRVNPLALEEFDAMQERHAFLAEQLEDLRRTRKDLLGIVEQVDRRVEEVFAAAYADVEKTFNDVFPRLFPGGEGRLVLTEPGQWLTTGVDVEARPAGKKVKRLSLLSGGERSLVAVAFLVSLFIARPSPFYILDEVEAALDDANLGRLLGIYEQLRESSQLLVITHQKRTMEIADALYGVTMRGDGVSAVISQKLQRES
ncbi:chromosome segregation protein SMC [Luteococcus sediminum]